MLLSGQKNQRRQLDDARHHEKDKTQIFIRREDQNSIGLEEKIIYHIRMLSVPRVEFIEIDHVLYFFLSFDAINEYSRTFLNWRESIGHYSFDMIP